MSVLKTTSRRWGRMSAVFTAATWFATLIGMAGAGEGKAANKVPLPPDAVEARKMRMGRVLKVATSRIELVPVADDLDDDEPGAPTRLIIPDRAFDQLVFGPGLGAQEARVQAAEVVQEKLDAIERICTLTDSQRKKLELAGRGDIERLLDRVETVRRKFETYTASEADLATLASRLSRETGPLRSKLHSDIYDDDSFFAKVLRRVLTQEQAARYDQRPSQFRSTLFVKLPDLKPSR